MITRRVETRRVQLPQEEWVEEPSNYILRLYLPHVFKKEDLNIMYEPSGKITIRGIKQLNTNRFVRFDSSFNVPKDSNFENISGILENNILSFTIPKIIFFKPSDKKKEELLIEEEKPKMAAEELKVPKEKPKMAEEEKKEEGPLLKEKAKIVTEEKPKMAEEEKKDGAVMKEMNELNGKLQTIKEPNLEERKDKIVPDEMKKEEPTVNENPNTFKDKDEEIHKDKPKSYYDDMEKKEDSIKNEDSEREVQQKSKKRRWIWNEEDKGWLDWMDSAFIDDVLKKVCRNKRFITLALVAFSTGFYISRKLRKKG